MEEGWTNVDGVIVAGHGIASGQSGDPRFPGGSVRLQSPHFLKAGVDLSAYHRGTLNISIAPRRYRVHCALHTIRNLAWLPNYPPEDFSFFNCRIRAGSQPAVDGLVYYPHPETKPEFHQDPSVLEVLAPWIEGLTLGDPVTLSLRLDEITVV